MMTRTVAEMEDGASRPAAWRVGAHAHLRPRTQGLPRAHAFRHRTTCDVFALLLT